MAIVTTSVDAAAEQYGPPQPAPPSASDLRAAYAAYHPAAAAPAPAAEPQSMAELAATLTPEAAQNYAAFDRAQAAPQRDFTRGNTSSPDIGARPQFDTTFGAPTIPFNAPPSAADNMADSERAFAQSHPDYTPETGQVGSFGLENLPVVGAGLGARDSGFSDIPRNLSDTLGAAVKPLGDLGEYALKHASLTGGVLGEQVGIPNVTLGDVAKKIPGGEPAISAIGQTGGYVAGDILSGGALTPVFGAQATAAVAAIGQAYKAGQIDGVTALKELAMTLPQAIPFVLHGAGALSDFARTPKGQQAIANVKEGVVAGESGQAGVVPGMARGPEDIGGGGGGGGKPPKGYQATQDAIDAYETALERKYGADVVDRAPTHPPAPTKYGPPNAETIKSFQDRVAASPLAPKELARLQELYRARDAIGAAQDASQLDYAMTQIPEGPAPEQMVRDALADLQQRGQVTNALGDMVDPQSMYRDLYTILSHKLARTGALPEAFAGDIEYAIQEAMRPSRMYGTSPKPLLDQVRGVVDSLTGGADVKSRLVAGERGQVPPAGTPAERSAAGEIPASPAAPPAQPSSRATPAEQAAFERQLADAEQSQGGGQPVGRTAAEMSQLHDTLRAAGVSDAEIAAMTGQKPAAAPVAESAGGAEPPKPPEPPVAAGDLPPEPAPPTQSGPVGTAQKATDELTEMQRVMREDQHSATQLPLGVEGGQADALMPSRTQEMANVQRTGQQLYDEVLAETGNRHAAEVIRQVVDTSGQRVAAERPLLDGTYIGDRIERALAIVRQKAGDLPSAVLNILGQEMQNVHDGLNILTERANGKLNPDRVFDEAATALRGGKVKYVGPDLPIPFASQPPEGQLALLYSMPSRFEGVPQGLRQRMAQLNGDNTHYGVFRRVDPDIATPAEGNYLRQTWADRPLGPGEVRQGGKRGEVSVAKERAYRNIEQGLMAGEQFPEGYTVRKAFADGQRLVNEGIADGVFKMETLRKYGTTDPARAKAEGMVEVSHPKFQTAKAQWYLPPEIDNFVNQLYAPGNPVLGPLTPVASGLKSLSVAPLDAGGFILRAKTGLVTNPGNILLGLLNEVTGRRFVDPSPNLPLRVQAVMDGVPQGLAGSMAAEVHGPMSRIPGYSQVNRAIMNLTWGGFLSGMRNLSYEGGLVFQKAVGRDVSVETGFKARTAVGEVASETTGAGREAIRQGRAQAERDLLFSARTTRGMVGMLKLASNFLNPAATTEQRLASAWLIAQTTFSIWGVGSLVNMKWGDGRPLAPPITWDNDKKIFRYNSSWGAPTIGGHTIPLIAERAVINWMAKSWTILYNDATSGSTREAIRSGDVSALPSKLGEAVAPTGALAVGRLGPAARAPAAIAGFGYDPGTGISLGNLSQTQRLLNAAPLPITISQYQKEGLLGMVLGSYPESASHKADTALRNAGVQDGIRATPQEKYQAAQKNPEVARALADVGTERAQRNDPAGKLQATVQTKLAGQGQRDQWLAAKQAPNGQPYIGKDWRAGLRQMEVELQQARTDFGQNIVSSDPVMQGYNAIWAKYSLPDGTISDKTALYDALDAYRADPKNTATLDKTLGWSMNQTPTMKRYSEVTQGLAKAGWFDIAKKLIAEDPEITTYQQEHGGAFPPSVNREITGQRLDLLMAQSPELRRGAVEFGFATSKKAQAIAQQPAGVR